MRRRLRTTTLALALISTCSTGCALTSQIEPSRDRSRTIAKAGKVTVWCAVPEDPKRVEECTFHVVPGDGLVPCQLRPEGCQ